jgi:hypothetical protein
MSLQALGLLGCGRTDEGLAMTEASVPLALALPPDNEVAQALVVLGSGFMSREGNARAMQLFERALALATDRRDWPTALSALIAIASNLTIQGRDAESLLYFEQARALLPRLGRRNLATLSPFRALAEKYRFLGRFAEAMMLLEDLMVEVRASPDYLYGLSIECELARVWLALGQPARAQSVMRPRGQLGKEGFLGVWLVTQARIEMALGRPALPLLDEAHELMVRLGRNFFIAIVDSLRAACLPPGEALVVAQASLARCEQLDLQGAASVLRMRICEALLALGRSREAASHALALAEGARRGDTAGHPPELWWTVHRAMEAVGDRGGARRALQQARDWIVDVALPNVPDPYKDSFLNRHPVHAAVLNAARSGGAAMLLGRDGPAAGSHARHGSHLRSR